MEPIKTEEQIIKEIKKMKKRVHSPMDLMLLLPCLVSFEKKSKLKHAIKIDSQSPELQKLSLDELFQIFCNLILFNIFKRDWGLKVRLVDQLIFSKMSNMFFVLYKNIDNQKNSSTETSFEGSEIEEIIYQQLFSKHGYVREQIQNMKNQLIKKYTSIDYQYRYTQLFIQLSLEFDFPLNPITSMIIILNKSLQTDQGFKKKQLNNTYEISEAFRMYGFQKSNNPNDPIIFSKLKSSNFQFKFKSVKTDSKESEDHQRPYCFELIMNKNLNIKLKQEQEEKNEKDKKKDKIDVDHACPIYFPYIINYMQETYIDHPIRFCVTNEKQSNQSFLKNQIMVLKFMVPISYLGEDEHRYREYIEKQNWNEFKLNLKKAILFSLCLENVMNQLKILEEDDKQKKDKEEDKFDKEDELSMMIRRMEMKQMTNLNAFWNLYEQIKGF